MAEILLKIGDGANYKDGDVVEAFNDRRILAIHADIICHVKNAGFQKNGLRPDGLSRDYLERVCQYRFERISEKAVKRTEISSGKVKIFSDKTKEYIFVEDFLRLRLKSNRHAIFGNPGAEVWFGGRLKRDQSAIDKAWIEIEQQTSNKKADFFDWPLTESELKYFLVVPTEDFDDAKREDLVVPEFDLTDPDIPKIIKKRKNKVEYLKSLEISSGTESKILDPNSLVDKPSHIVPYVLTDIIETK